MRLLRLIALAICVPLYAAPVRLSADDFLSQIASGELTQTKQKATFYFAPGKPAKIPQSLQKLMIHLAAQGTEVSGTIVDEDTYLKKMTDAAQEEISYELTGFEKATTPAALGAIPELLGVPYGVQGINLNPAKALKDFSAEERQILLETTAIHNFVLLTGLQMAGNLTVVPLVALTSYFYQVFGNISEILKFKGQGHIVVRNGNDLSTDVNPYFLFLTNLVEETAINGTMEATIPSPDPFSMSTVMANSFTFGLAKTSVDQYSARMEKKYQKALKDGNDALAKTIRAQQFFVMKLFFNGVIPVLRTLALLTKKTHLAPMCSAIQGGTFAIAGCHAIATEMVRMGKLRFLPKKYAGKSCAKALVVFEPAEMIRELAEVGS